mmetsp:Transcript_29053/g.70876  ORF Transcript_29053/g.70876 Transcript_29053/m.70876 type:complete len:155 (+) Transcript_29053:152-616(+)|eukprot:CAMPEP_0114519644 /NCGR_PEP_ID=MMETSP0109-20121206/19127_1 /TAXON_ID=29199 /ORGANISM="Chlorarachnion reptans, Strain CCCM449" /LENGTH=154 /DNA_ID=CAMNT_0001700425 /DNA_START=82 /DNA_END=546 /DNA_ORIENTATION=-
MAKGKVRKHTAKELQAKLDAQKSKGGGKKGKADRKPKCKLVCKVCMVQLPSVKGLKEHFVNKHPKMPFRLSDYGITEEEDTKQKKPAPKPKETKKVYPNDEKIKAALVKLYTEKDPEKLGNVDKIMAKYSGKWSKLEEGLSKKYGPVDLIKLSK